MTPGPHTFWKLGRMSSLVLVATSCAQVLGLEDPNGRLDDGAGGASQAGTGSAATQPTSTGATQPTGGEGGGTSVAVTGSTGSDASTSTGAGGDASSTSSSTGGGAPVGGVVELPEQLVVEALGPSPGGASILVRHRYQGGGLLCDEESAPGSLVVARLREGTCELVDQIAVSAGDGPKDPEVQGFSVALVNGFVAVAGAAPTAAQLFVAQETLDIGSGVTNGFGAWWTPGGAGRLFGTLNGWSETFAAVLPYDGGSHFALSAPRAILAGPDVSCSLDAFEPPGRRALVAELDLVNPGCRGVDEVAPGRLLDATSATSGSWLLIDPDDATPCSVALATGSEVSPPTGIGACAGPGSIFANGDDVYVATAASGPCGGKVFGVAPAVPAGSAVWCDAGGSQTTSLDLFHVDARVWFARVEPERAEVIAGEKDGSPPETVRELCTGCALDGIEMGSDGTVYFAGIAGGGGATVLGYPVAGARSFWAWIPLAEL